MKIKYILEPLVVCLIMSYLIAIFIYDLRIDPTTWTNRNFIGYVGHFCILGISAFPISITRILKLPK